MLKQMFHVGDEYLVELALTVAHVYALNSLEKTTGIKDLFGEGTIDKEPGLLQIKEKYGNIPSWWKLAALDKEEFNILWEREQLIFSQDKMEIKLKELIGLVISISNGCKESAIHYKNRLINRETKEKEMLEAIWVMENFHRNVKVNDGVLTVPGDLLDAKQSKKYKT